MHYASALFRYLKEFCVEFKENTTLVCMDDNHAMKIVETWSSFSCKRHPVDGSDHDFAKLSMIPSVILRVDIPNAVEDSWYRGQA